MDLVICHTSLQVEIVLRLLDKGVISEFEFVFCPDVDNEQMLYFYNKLSGKAKCSTYAPKMRGRFNPVFFAWTFRGKIYDKVLFANIEKMYIQFVLSVIHFSSIETFDDGSANICKNSMLFTDETSPLRDLIYYVMGRRFNKLRIRETIACHYSLYDSTDNISSKLQKISLDLKVQRNLDPSLMKERAIVLIGGVFQHMFSELETLEKKVIQAIGDGFYFIPHPRDTSGIFSLQPQLTGHEIAEVKIMQLLQEYHSIDVYGFSSSAQLHLSDISRLQMFTFINPSFRHVAELDFNTTKIVI